MLKILVLEQNDGDFLNSLVEKGVNVSYGRTKKAAHEKNRVTASYSNYVFFYDATHGFCS